MENNNLCEEKRFPSASPTAISFDLLTNNDKEKLSVLEIETTNGVTDPKLGMPNQSNQCTTCGANTCKSCEGHFGLIKFPSAIVHPFFMSEVVQVLNKVCPGCKSIRSSSSAKVADPSLQNQRSRSCKYCAANSRLWYPRMKFKISSKETFRRATVIAEVSERLPRNLLKRRFRAAIADDYWHVIPQDGQEVENATNPNQRILTQAQIFFLLKDVDPDFIKRYILRRDLIPLNCFPVTPNCKHVTEGTHAFANTQQWAFDNQTRAYKKLVDFRGTGNELSFRVLTSFKMSKINPEKVVNDEYYTGVKKRDIDSTTASGLRWIKDVVLGKRSDHSFRMVVVGDPNLKLSEVGIPCHIAERMRIPEHLTAFNLKKLYVYGEMQLHQKGEIIVRRDGNLVPAHRFEELHIGDIIYRPLLDGDIVLINKPPSIHPHSLIALTVKVLPVAAVLAINPLCCSPFYGDFDGDCLHGYVPQSIGTMAELSELVALDKQLTNLLSGKNLLSLSQDSLTATHLLTNDVVSLNLFQLQQLQMYCPNKSFSPAILKAPSLSSCVWTGKQLISMLLPRYFEHGSPSSSICIRDGEVISSRGSLWLHDTDNLFEDLARKSQGQFLDTLYAAQEVLGEWLSIRGLSVSLSDLYLCKDSDSRKNMMDEIFYGLQGAENALNMQPLLVDPSYNFVSGEGEEDENGFEWDVKKICYVRQRSAALSQSSIDAFSWVFYDIQNLVYRYASGDNSFIAMMKAGSKGSQSKLVQHSICLGMQNSLVPLSFRMPDRLSCAGWCNQKFDGSIEFAKCYIPSAVVRNSFLTGLNPIECFVHSVTSRESLFSDNAYLPGTLTRKLMFFMRDLYASYDGTVRSSYGNQLVQFSYGNYEDTSESGAGELFNNFVGIAGQRVGTLAACAISEAAYSALDQPISLLQKSPLLSLKNIMECGAKRKSAKQTISLYLSERVRRQHHGAEYAALEIQNHLEKLLFSDIVSFSMITYSPRSSKRNQFCPWVCHFHLYQEIVRKRKLKIPLIIDALYKRCQSENYFPNIQIVLNACSMADAEKEKDETCCITVSFIEKAKDSSTPLETVQYLLLPSLLQTVLKGISQVKKVEILWNSRKKKLKLQEKLSGELFLRIHMSGNSDKIKFWNLLVNECIPIMDMIDWTRSHPDNIHDLCMAYGIDAGWKLFLNNLEVAICDIGKTVLPEHLLLVASCLSVTGEFVGLNVRGLKQQREHASVPSPFVQASFTNPGDSFIKAAKSAVRDDLLGCLDALIWGIIPPVGTGQFDVVYSDKSNQLTETGDVYKILASSTVLDKQTWEMPKAWSRVSEKCGALLDGSTVKELNVKSIRSCFRTFLSYNDVRRLSHMLRRILNSYSIDEKLTEKNKVIVSYALYFHPRRHEKIGVGAIDFKVINHPEHPDTRCFCLVKADGTTEDFSYHECILTALEIIAPQKARGYRSRYLQAPYL